MKNKIFIGIIVILLLVIGLTTFAVITRKDAVKMMSVNISNLTYKLEDNDVELTTYTQDDFDKFYDLYNSNSLPDIYVTKFLFDGVGMYKTYDLDDYIENGNILELEPFEITVININTTGKVELSGEITGMIAVDTNKLDGDLSIILNGVKIDTDSKKVPAIYIYNKDITYTDHTVTIVANDNTKNYIEGGKLKKISLIPSDNLDEYKNKYTGNASEYYNVYVGYYGIYTKSEIENILFAKVTADNEDLADGDPYYYYKGSGAISSDIDLYFEGSGYLEVTSKNKEGIETKGNLEFKGGIGDYFIKAEDDCLNTTTSNNENENARNTLTIDVNSLTAIVSNDADEGDAIDSNGSLYINGGTIYAFAKNGSDAGLDSELGTYINGGTLIATGDMLDEISSNSKQNFVILSFEEKPENETTVVLLDKDDNVIFAYTSDRTYSNLVYSSSNLKEGTYYLYKNGTITGDIDNGVYKNITNYEKGLQYGYVQSGIQNNGGMPNNEIEEKPDNNRPDDMTPPDNNGNMTPPDNTNMPNNMDEAPSIPDNDSQNFNQVKGNATNKEFTISGIANQFSGIAVLSE